MTEGLDTKGSDVLFYEKDSHIVFGCMYPVSYLYNLKTKVKKTLVTPENVINPQIAGNYSYGQGEPNKTFYDAEVCIYDISKNEWIYKINNGYSEYQSLHDVYLNALTAEGDYLYWNTGAMYLLILFGKADNKLYNIVAESENKQIGVSYILDGGLLLWFETPRGAPGDAKPTQKCV